MIRSGEHELWDAHMACGRARAEREALLAAFAPLRRSMRQLGQALTISAQQAERSMRAFGISYARAMRNAEVTLAAWNRPSRRSTKEQR